jgi:hypothetical protein
MEIPTLFSGRFVDKDGFLTPGAKNMFSQLLNELQTRMSEESHVVPSKTTAQLSDIESEEKYFGGHAYDTDKKKAVVNIDGTFKEIQTT